MQVVQYPAAATAAAAAADVAPSTARRRRMNPVRWAKKLLRSVFLPVGWPGSVAPEYLRFQAWNVIQDLSTYLRGILATKAILEGVVRSIVDQSLILRLLCPV